MMTGDEFASTLYSKLPKIYRTYDTDLVLYRYLGAIGDSFSPTMELINDFVNVVNPYTCPDDYIPVMCDCFYIPYYRDIPLVYYRKLLSDISNLRVRKGTTNCVEYLCRVLTGLEVDIDRENDDDHILEITLTAESLDKVLDIDVSTSVISSFIKDFIPFYIHTVNIISEVTETGLNVFTVSFALMTVEEDVNLPRFNLI